MRDLKKSQAKVVFIGGGTGGFTMLSGLRNHFKNIAAIVTMADDGGSSGILREDFGILPPGDVRQALVALSAADNKILSELFNYRFKEGRLKEQSFGNMMITALERITGKFDQAIREAATILSVEGDVIPVTLKNVHLEARLAGGKVLRGEHVIGGSRNDQHEEIKEAWLTPAATANPEAIRAIREANLIVIGPGSLYTSIVPNLLVRGIPEALKKTKAKVVYFVNLTTNFGETTGFTARDFVRTIEDYAGKNVIDYVVVNKKRPSPALLKRYLEIRSELVQDDLRGMKRPRVIRADLLRARGFLRHDPDRAARIIRVLADRSKTTGK